MVQIYSPGLKHQLLSWDKVTNGEGSKVNVNGTNGTAEVTLRNKKTRVNEDGGRTTMVVRLHPGQTNRLSAYVEDQVTKCR